MKKTFVVFESIDGKEYVSGVFIGTETEVIQYCAGQNAESEMEAYGGDNDYDEPYPYVSHFFYKETTMIYH